MGHAVVIWNPSDSKHIDNTVDNQLPACAFSCLEDLNDLLYAFFYDAFQSSGRKAISIDGSGSED